MGLNIVRFHFCLILIFTLIGFGCDKRNKDEDKISITASDRSKAEELIESAEQLVNPYSFMLAYKLAALAVEKILKISKLNFTINF